MTIKDIAKICGVSSSTVSRAINGERGINKNTYARIMQVVEEYGFVPNNNARNMRCIESNTIALLMKGIHNQFLQDVVERFYQELGKLSFNFILQPISSEENEFDVANQMIQEKKLKGLIFLGGLINDAENVSKKLTIPCVRCTGAIAESREAETFGFTSVGINDELESWRVVDYLCSLGHRKIGILSAKEEDNSIGGLRIAGYRRALREHGIECDPRLISVLDKAPMVYSVDNGYEATKQLLDRGVEFTALFVTSDVMALGAYCALKEYGKRIPEDVSVFGFDGLEMGKYYSPSLATLKQPVEDIVKACVEQLMLKMDGKEAQDTVFFEGELVIGDSIRRIDA